MESPALILLSPGIGAATANNRVCLGRIEMMNLPEVREAESVGEAVFFLYSCKRSLADAILNKSSNYGSIL